MVAHKNHKCVQNMQRSHLNSLLNFQTKIFKKFALYTEYISYLIHPDLKEHNKELILEEIKKHLSLIQRPKLSKIMQFTVVQLLICI